MLRLLANLTVLILYYTRGVRPLDVDETINLVRQEVREQDIVGGTQALDRKLPFCGPGKASAQHKLMLWTSAFVHSLT